MDWAHVCPCLDLLCKRREFTRPLIRVLAGPPLAQSFRTFVKVKKCLEGPLKVVKNSYTKLATKYKVL